MKVYVYLWVFSDKKKWDMLIGMMNLGNIDIVLLLLIFIKGYKKVYLYFSLDCE